MIKAAKDVAFEECFSLPPVEAQGQQGHPYRNNSSPWNVNEIEQLVVVKVDVTVSNAKWVVR